ncbi:MAG: hypothetical protein ACOYLI_02400 [Synechococcus lacustris]
MKSDRWFYALFQLGSPLDYLSHSRGLQELKALMLEEGVGKGRLEGLEEGRKEGEAAFALRQLARRCGPLTPAPSPSRQAFNGYR